MRSWLILPLSHIRRVWCRVAVVTPPGVDVDPGTWDANRAAHRLCYSPVFGSMPRARNSSSISRSHSVASSTASVLSSRRHCSRRSESVRLITLSRRLLICFLPFAFDFFLYVDGRHVVGGDFFEHAVFVVGALRRHGDVEPAAILAIAPGQQSLEKMQFLQHGGRGHRHLQCL